MVKSGEEYFSEVPLEFDQNGRVTNQDSRARLISNPGDVTCGTATYIQSVLFPAIKRAVPGFIQGLTKKQMLTLFKSKITTDHDSVSADGSGFDSSQNKENMQCSDNQFWIRCQPEIERILAFNDFEDPVSQSHALVKDLVRTENFLFVK